MKVLLRLFAMALLIAAALPASAHEGSTSYLVVDAKGSSPGLAARYDVALIDVAWSVPLDADGDGRLTWREIAENRPAIAEWLRAGLRLARGGRPCALDIGEPWLTERLGLPYLSFDISAACPRAGTVGIASSLFFDSDAYHRVLVSVATPRAMHAATLAPGLREWAEPATVSAWRTALEFLRQGMFHVWVGYDHLVFLLLLLLPAVVRGKAHAGGRAILLDLARIVTAFTVAHSITLGLAATAVIRLPQQPIEVAIAMSLVVAGVLNLLPQWWRLRLPLAFGFGLVHGFGFANALAGLDTGHASVLPVLAGFNVGVELANLAVIAVLLPLLLWTGRFRWYAPRAMPALSMASAVLGAMWMVQRL
jgi:HupE / UreJ protein